MRIIFAISVIDIGGAEVLALRLAQKLHERGHEIIIYAANEKIVNKKLIASYSSFIESWHSLADWPRVRFIISKLNSFLRRLSFGDALINKVRKQHLRSIIKLKKVDLVCSHSPRSDIVCENAIINLDIPLVMIEHGIYSHYLYKKRDHLLKPLLSATKIITVSDFCNRQIKTYLGESSKVTTIYNGVEIETQQSRSKVRNELGIQDSEIVYGLSARGIPKKGWQPAIDAFLKLKNQTHKKVHLILIGGSGYVNELKEKYKEHKEIYFIGKVPNPLYYIDAVDVGLMLSMYRTEALSLIAIEFLMLGKPIIATNVGGVPEVLQQYGTSLCKLIDLEADESINIEQLKNEMLLFTNGEKGLALEQIQIESTNEKFSMEKCVRAYENLFHHMVLNKNKNHSNITQRERRNKAISTESAEHIQ